jgi:F0F1-type ATP synthase membrane subunit c/vacuolar-type H+-ATPase subunit K
MRDEAEPFAGLGWYGAADCFGLCGASTCLAAVEQTEVGEQLVALVFRPLSRYL